MNYDITLQLGFSSGVFVAGLYAGLPALWVPSIIGFVCCTIIYLRRKQRGESEE